MLSGRQLSYSITDNGRILNAKTSSASIKLLHTNQSKCLKDLMKVAHYLILQDTSPRLHYFESTLKVIIFKKEEEILDSREEIKFCENFLCLRNKFYIRFQKTYDDNCKYNNYI